MTYPTTTETYFSCFDHPTSCRDESSKSLMNFIHPHEKTFIRMERQMFHLHLEIEK
jgi:hypothetical protein